MSQEQPPADPTPQASPAAPGPKSLAPPGARPARPAHWLAATIPVKSFSGYSLQFAGWAADPAAKPENANSAQPKPTGPRPPAAA
ncbi:AAR145W-Ap [Eremothecium gossypii ATCC 10895]|uniref:AAR145W-Ap n=1 Tax=Eremothecium gossypii (strain ATCC 10895 / CBS 109.51 / FGSC 9923 / NRRL Y-1056) TaxID=284811 RepID=Q75EC9_EREGS|nr:AAR145W-Ap [Eremothecium gossypii ATCC 10895]AAS50512.1 AAR145W-Ap [Eremothecium gossypii ATCC 10895]AEY94799.1 FAAR145W-Ap [Eremothecium gossypii FDAG1]